MHEQNLYDLADWIYNNLNVRVDYHVEYDSDNEENIRYKDYILDELRDFPFIFEDENTQERLEEIYWEIFKESGELED